MTDHLTITDDAITVRPQAPPGALQWIGLVITACVVVGVVSAVGTVFLIVRFAQGATVNLFQVATPIILAGISGWVLRHYLLMVKWLRSEETISTEGGMLVRRYPNHPDAEPIPLGRINSWQTDATRAADKALVAFMGDPLQGTPEEGFGGTVRFSYKGHWHHFGPQLTEAEAEEVIKALRATRLVRIN